MSDLTYFLLARIAEDEAMARSFDEELAREFGAPAESLLSSELTLAGSGDMDYPVLTIDSTRVLAECEAKRSLIATMTKPDTLTEATAARVAEIARRVVLGHLALPYADHPDYREEWKP